MSLEKIYNVWKASGDADTSVGAVRRYNKTHDHFNLNAYLKMRVFIALQIHLKLQTPCSKIVVILMNMKRVKQYPI